MAITMGTPQVDQLDDVVRALRDWQHDASPLQLHPGDLGWCWRFGADATAAAVRTWSRDGQIVGLGLLDGPDLLRATVAPHAWRDEDLAAQMVADVSDPERGVLPAGAVSVETPDGCAIQHLLTDAGWPAGEPWTPLRRDLARPVDGSRPADGSQVRTGVVGSEQAADVAAVIGSAFGSTRFTTERWHTMAAGSPFVDARCLLARDGAGVAVAGVTVWSAGAGQPGLIEPMGVHADHRGRGYGRAITLAGAAALRALGSSTALVCTPSALVGAIATYEAAGFVRLPERLDRTRDG